MCMNNFMHILFDREQALSGKDNAVDTEIMRLLARERDKSRDLRVC
jgi:hypothetical protein